MHKRLTATVLTVAIITSCSASTVVLADTLDNQLKQQKQEMAEHKKDYDEAQKIVEELNSKIELLDSQIEETLYETEELNKTIAEIEQNVETANREIEQAEKDMEAEKELYGERISAMYMGGRSNYVEVLLGSKNLSDLLSRIQTIKTITELDEEIIANLEAKQAKIEKSKKEMEEQNVKLASTKSIYDEKMLKLQEDKDDQQSYIDKANKEATAYANVLNKDKAQIAKTQKLIDQARNNTPSYDPSRGSASISSSAIVAYASNYLGRPYRWGATGPNSFDCSGFTSYVFAHFGVNLPRTSRSQGTVGSYVSKSKLKPGDLVFFAKPGRAIHHVGIYVGNNSYIHSPQTGDVVKISSLSSRSDYYTARRVY
ncbi:NlpC/P60 family protein [Clostridium sediminicola]|uniref:C40 family peptidase n=1 Tax=Clostridium sediminicola TaxID=3114879 RepID=UPI0031F274BA